MGCFLIVDGIGIRSPPRSYLFHYLFIISRRVVGPWTGNIATSVCPSVRPFGNIEKCPFTYWLIGRWFLQIVDRDSGNLYPIYPLFPVLIFYLKCGGGWGGGGAVFLAFYAISNIYLCFCFLLDAISNIFRFFLGKY